MRRWPAIPLILWFLALGSGAVGQLHNLHHDELDAAATHPFPAEKPHHDDSNCLIHAQLHMPLMAAGWVPLLICLGLFVAFLTLLSPRLLPQPAENSIHCRGPPACQAISF